MQTSVCPPAAEQPPVRCAKEGENCRSSYLAQQNLEGCCDGLACKPDASGLPLCETATADEIALTKQCSKAAYNGTGDSVKLMDPIPAASGAVMVNVVYVALDKGPVVGPGGCIVSITLELDTCTLTLNLSKDATGTYDVTAEYPATCELDGLGQTITGTASFDGVACEGGIGGYCYTGTFELRLMSTSRTGQPVLTGTPFHLQGNFCPFSDSNAASCTG